MRRYVPGGAAALIPVEMVRVSPGCRIKSGSSECRSRPIESGVPLVGIMALSVLRCIAMRLLESALCWS